MIWHIIAWFWIFCLAAGVARLAWLIFIGERALRKASNERAYILCSIYNWPARTGRKRRAIKEYNQVTLKDHAKAIRHRGPLYKPIILYGPIIQTLYRGDFSFLAEKQWWRCYKEIYLEMGAMQREECRFAFYKVQLYAQTSDFFVALQLINVDGYTILQQNDVRGGKTLMDAGADEYDEAMAAQELMQ